MSKLETNVYCCNSNLKKVGNDEEKDRNTC